jgi:hypothetical protein
MLLAACNPKVATPGAFSVGGPENANTFTVSVENKFYRLGETITINFTHPSAVVLAGGIPKLSLDIGGNLVEAAYVAGSGTNTISFNYIVVMNDLDLNGIDLNQTIDLDGASITFDNNGSIENVDLNFILPDLSGVKVDAVTPTISSISIPSAKTYYLNEQLNFTVVFSENVIVTGQPQIALDMGGDLQYAQYVSGSGSNSLVFRKTVSATDIDNNGILISSPISLNSGTIKDQAGNNANLSYLPPDTSSIVVNGAAPIVTSVIKPTNGTYVLDDILDFKITFNKIVNVSGAPVIGLNMDGSVVTLNYVSGSGTNELTFNYQVLLGDVDQNGIEIDQQITLSGGTIKDTSNNNAKLNYNYVSLGGVHIYAVAPTIVSISTPANALYTTSQGLIFDVEFSEIVNITGNPRMAIQLASGIVYANYLTGTGTNSIKFRYIVNSLDNDNNGLELNSPLALNGGTIKSNYNISAELDFIAPATTGLIINDSSPYITSISAPNNSTYTETQNLDFTINWSENIVVSGTPRLAIDVGGNTKYALFNAGLSNSTTSVFRYTVANMDLDLNGISLTPTIDLNGGSIQDIDLNNARLDFITSNLSGVLIDATPTQIVSITPPNNGYYRGSQNLNFTANFNKNVTVTNSPRLALTVGASTIYANYLSGSGTSQLVFQYIVDVADNDNDGISLNSPLDLNAGSIKDNNNLNAELSFSAPNTSAIFVDNIAPSITSVVAPSNGSYGAGQNLNFIINFSETVVVTGIDSSLSLTVGAINVNAICSAVTAPSTTCSYAIQPSDSDLDGVEITSPLQLNSSTITDQAGNTLTLNFAPPASNGVIVDNNTPVLALSTPSDNSFINISNNSTFFTVMGTCNSPGSTAVIKINGSTASGTTGLLCDGLNFIGTISTTGLAEGVHSIVAEITNGANVTGTSFANTVTKDITAPSIAITTAANIDTLNVNSYLVNGTCDEENGEVSLSFGAVSTTVTCLSGVWEKSNWNVSSEPDNALKTISVTIQDSAGNISPDIQTTVLKDTTAPLVAITSPLNNSFININNNSNIYSISGTCNEPSEIVSIKIDGTLANSQSGFICDGSNFNGTIDTTGLSENNHVITAELSDINNNTGTSPNINIIKDITPPTIVLNSLSTGSFTAGEMIDLFVSYSETVNVLAGVPSTTFIINSGNVQANYISGTGSSNLIFRYLVQATDLDNDGIQSSTTISLNSSTIRDSAGNNAILDLATSNFPATIISQTSALSFAQTNTFNFGQISLGNSVDTTFVINYTGTAPAISVSSSNPSAQITFKGGSFPGTGGTCSNTISSNCTIILTYTPNSAGTHNTTLSISYNNGLTNLNINRNLTGEGVSSTPTKLSVSGSTGIITNNCIPYTINAQTTENTNANVNSNVTVNLIVNNGTGTFYSDENCSSTTTSRIINTGTSSVPIYFKTTSAGQTLTLVFNSTTLSNTTKLAISSNEPIAIYANISPEIITNECVVAELSLLDSNGVKTGSSTTKTINIGKTGSVQIFSDPFCTGSISSLIFSPYQDSKNLYLKNMIEENTTFTFTDQALVLTQDSLAVDFVSTLTWWDNLWYKRKKITLNNLDQASIHSNLPVLVKLNTSRVDYSHFQSNGEDIRFTLSDHTTVLSHSIEKWNSSGDSFIWVKLDNIAANSEVDIYMYYDNPSAIDNSNATGVFATFNGVWNMDKTGVNYIDSSGTGKTGIAVGALSDISGPVGNATSYNGSSTLDVSYNLAQIIGKTSTLSFWVKTTQVGSNTNWQAPGITGVEQSGGGNDIFFGFIRADGTLGVNSGNTGLAKSNFVINDNSWRYVTMSRNETTGLVKFYVNGVLNGSGTSETGYKSTAFSKFGMIDDTGGTPVHFNGALDGIRLNASILSDDRIKAEFKFQADTHISFGQLENL